MNLCASLVKLKLFQIKEKYRQLNQLDLMVSEFERMANELDMQIQLEEKKTGIIDLNHFAYPTLAKAARQRRDNLFVSIRDLMLQKEAAEVALSEAEEELAKTEALSERSAKTYNGKDSPSPHCLMMTR